jgi:hypothetical protein
MGKYYYPVPKSTFNSIFGRKKSRQIFLRDRFSKMPETNPQTVQEANEALFNAKWNLPKAAQHCGMTNKEMKMTFREFLKYHPPTYLTN